MFIIQVTRGVNPQGVSGPRGGTLPLGAEVPYISEEEKGPKGGGWKGRLTQALQTRPRTPGSAIEGFLEVTFIICYSIVFDIPRPAALLIRGHELHFTS